MELLSGHEKIITKSEISLNAGTLNRVFTVYARGVGHCVQQMRLQQLLFIFLSATVKFRIS
jgi:hypothetical protein